MASVREDWLETTRESALDPGLPICDPHHHLWVHRGRYLLEDFLRDVSGGHNVVSSVFVACDAMYRTEGPPELRPVGETEFVEGVANEALRRATPTTVAAGIVGFADLTLGPGVARVLEAHLAASPSRFRGIRHSVTWDASPAVHNAAPNARAGWMADPSFRAGFACLARYELSYDAWLFHPQLPELVSLARAFPQTAIVLNHVGGPLGEGPYAGRRAEVLADWRKSMAAVARCTNVVVKLGGFGMPRMGFGWDAKSVAPTSAELAAAAEPYVAHCIEQFGPDRCMFESNFPSDKVSYSYGVVWNAFKRMAAKYTPAERNALFHDTAVRTYRLTNGAGGRHG